MDIIITAGELLDKGVWIDYCNLAGVNEWAINEGLMEREDKITLNRDIAKQLGLI